MGKKEITIMQIAIREDHGDIENLCKKNIKNK